MPRKYYEHSEQVAFINLASKRRYLGGYVRDYLYAIPNAGTTGGRRAQIAGARRRAEGVTAGVPDIECFVARPPYTGLYIEFKREDGVPSDVSKAQREMMARLESCGRKCVVAFGVLDAWQKLCEYLGIKTGL